MTEYEFTNAMSHLGDCFGISFPEKQVKAWFMYFYKETAEDFMKAVCRYVCSSSYKPTVHALKMELLEVTDEAFGLDVAKEWEKAQKYISNGGEDLGDLCIPDEDDRKAFEAAYGPIRSNFDPPSDFTKEVLNEMGGVRMLSQSSDSWEWMHREFEKKFNDKLNQRKKILMMDETLRSTNENAFTNFPQRAIPGDLKKELADRNGNLI